MGLTWIIENLNFNYAKTILENKKVCDCPIIWLATADHSIIYTLYQRPTTTGSAIPFKS